MTEGSHAQARIRRTLLLAVLFSLGAGLVLNPLALNRAITRNVDLWWHLNTGAWIVRHHTLPATDPFTTIGGSQRWVAYSWLFQLSLFGFYRWFGLLGTVVYTVALVLAIAIALYHAIQARWASFPGAIALSAVGLVAMCRLYTARPWLFTILFFIIEMDVLLAALDDPQGRGPSRRLWLLPLIFAVWANLHIQFVYGLALLGLAALTQDLGVFVGPKGARITRTPYALGRVLWAVAGVSFLATLLSPSSWRVYAVILGLTKQRVPYRTVMELMPPTFYEPLDYVVVLIALGGAFILGRAAVRYTVFAALLFVGETVAFLHVVRDQWMVVVTVLLLAAVTFGRSSRPAAPLPGIQRMAAVAIAVLFLVLLGKARGISNADLEARVANTYPTKAAETVSQRALPGPLFNDFNWGGYLEWRLPQLRALIDSRMNVGGDDLIQRTGDTWACLGEWKTNPDLAAANLVIGGRRFLWLIQMDE